MLSLNRLRKEAENLDSDDGIKLVSGSEISIVCDNGSRIEIPAELARKVFGSPENLEKVKECFSGSESLELHNVKLSDDVWVLVEEIFSLVDEV